MLWLWLRSLRRPAVSLRVGACECLGVCPCACLWLAVGLGTRQGPGRMGAQGPGWAVPRPAGGSEAPGLRGAGRGGPRSQTTSGAGPSVPEQRTGWGEVRRAGPGLERPRAGGRRDLRAPHPIPTPPPGPARTHARTHARTPGRWGPPGPGQAVAGWGVAVFGGRGSRPSRRTSG